jgi:hypothetical protein
MFKTEVELVESFCTVYKKFYKQITNAKIGEVFLIREFNSQFGIADIVIGTLQQKDKHCDQIPTREDWLHPLINFKLGQRFNLSDSQSLFGLSRENLKKRLEIYLLNGYLEIDNDGCFVVLREYDLRTDNTVSVEAKLKDWKRALLQAKRYTRFSTFSFVLIDEASSASAQKNLNEFVESNIGLVTFNGRDLVILNTPTPNYKTMRDYAYRLNEVATHHSLLERVK